MKTIVIQTDGTFVVNENPPRDSDGTVAYQHLSSAVGGMVEIVPHFERFTHAELNLFSQRCIAFCNEEGKLKDLPVNRLATAKWWALLTSMFGAGSYRHDYLVGDVIFVLGTKKELEEML